MIRQLPSTLIALVMSACTTTPQPVEEHHPPSPGVDPLDRPWALAAQLQGEWKNTLDSGDTLSYEHWTLADSATMIGTGFVLVGSDTVFIEHLRIARSSTGIRYSARISSQNNGEWIDFTLTAAQGYDTLRFMNPQHDFPTELRYVHGIDGAWDVLVSGNGRSFPLRYVRR
jgi:hypothetical protein